MLSFVVRIVKKLHWPQLLVCVWAQWHFDYTTQLQCPLALYQRHIFIYVFFLLKDGYGKYFSFATLGSCVACLGAKVFKIPLRAILADFQRRMSRDQNWSLLIVWFPCDPKNAWWCGIALLVKIICPLVIAIFWTVSSTWFITSA